MSPEPDPSLDDGGNAVDERRLVVVSGLSGAGKASVLRALEDLGFEAIDNAPLPMLEELVWRAARDGRVRMAIGVDARTHGFDGESVRRSLEVWRRDQRLCPELVFACADDSVLQQRFSETRRRHPLAESGRVQDGIDAERRLTAELREVADFVIDTSNLPLGELRRLIAARYSTEAHAASPALAVTLMSFAFPAGLPRESDMVMDVRFLRNPHYVTALRPMTGLDDEVGDYVRADADFTSFYDGFRSLLDLLLPRFVQEGKKYFTAAIGCTGGRHRSVFVVRQLADHLAGQGWQVSVVHRELARLDQPATRRREPADRPAQTQEA